MAATFAAVSLSDLCSHAIKGSFTRRWYTSRGDASAQASPRRKISVATSRSFRPSPAARNFISRISSGGKSNVVFMRQTFHFSNFLSMPPACLREFSSRVEDAANWCYFTIYNLSRVRDKILPVLNMQIA